MTNEGPNERAVIAKYCLQDCNLLHTIFNKLDFMTGYVEMAKLCSVPIDFLVRRGQGIKLTSYLSKKCREKGVLMPVVEKNTTSVGFEGAIVLEPKRGLYVEKPIACVDFASLYPSCIISENISHDSKVWTKEYDLEGELIKETGEKDENDVYIHDNLDDYEYLDIRYDTYEYVKKTPKAAAKKVKCGYKICHYAQYPEGRGRAILPSILEELLAARKATKKMIKTESNTFMKNILDKRQLSIKLTANSLYGATGAKTSSFCDIDVAASTTATGRKLLIEARDYIEEEYNDREVDTEQGLVKTNAEYIYGDSVTPDTPLLLRNKTTGDVCFKQIDNLADENIWTSYEGFKTGETNRKDKQQATVGEYEIFTSSGWSDINRVIRHKTQKQIYRVVTHTGMVDVTEDHSLLDEELNIVKPGEAKIGNKLLHNYPCPQDARRIFSLADILDYISNIEHKTIEEKEAFIFGFFFGDGSCGTYECSSGLKYSWALNNSDKDLTDILCKICIEVFGFDFKICDTLESSGVYKVNPHGGAGKKCTVKMVNIFRQQCYNKDKFKIVPTKYLNAEANIKMAYLSGYYGADGTKCHNQKSKNIFLSNKGKIGSAMLFYMFRSLGMKVSVNTRKDKENITNLTITSNQQRKHPNVIKKIYPLYCTSEEQYVYDIETETGNFNTGYPLIVKNTDSVFFTFNLEDLDGKKITGKKALELTIKLGQEAGKTFTQKHLKYPHDLEYEKVFWPWFLMSKKRYVGMLYEMSPDECYRKSMGLVLKRRDNAPIVKDIYGGIIDILMGDTGVKKSIKIEKAIKFLHDSLRTLKTGQVPLEKLIISKSLRSGYKNPRTIAHKVLADRITERDPGNKPSPGDRMDYAFIVQPNKKALQGERIETPEYIQGNQLALDYNFYITNSIMKPVQQVFSLILEDIKGFKKKKGQTLRIWKKELEELRLLCDGDEEKYKRKEETLRNKEVKMLLFDEFINL